jgi:hypothetical protein
LFSQINIHITLLSWCSSRYVMYVTLTKDFAVGHHKSKSLFIKYIPIVGSCLLMLLEVASRYMVNVVIDNHVPRSLGFCVLFGRSVFVLFILIIILSVFRRFPASTYLFGIIKPFFACKISNAFVFCLFVCLTLFCFIYFIVF